MTTSNTKRQQGSAGYRIMEIAQQGMGQQQQPNDSNRRTQRAATIARRQRLQDRECGGDNSPEMTIVGRSEVAQCVSDNEDEGVVGSSPTMTTKWAFIGGLRSYFKGDWR